MRRARPTGGFTLIEVLVALAIAAVGLAAVLATVTATSRNFVYLRDKLFASWIAENRLTELRVANAMPSVDKTSGDLEYAGSKWKWEQAVTQTEVQGMRRIDVSVRRDGDAADSALVTVTGFVGQTQLLTPPSTTAWGLDPGAVSTLGGSPEAAPTNALSLGSGTGSTDSSSPTGSNGFTLGGPSSTPAPPPAPPPPPAAAPDEANEQ